MYLETIEIPGRKAQILPYDLWNSAFHLVTPNPETTSHLDEFLHWDEDVSTEISGHWQAGFSYLAECCLEGGCWPNCNDCDPVRIKPCENGSEIEEYLPYQIFVNSVCTTANINWRSREKRASIDLQRIQSRLIETNLEIGDCNLDDEGFPINDYLGHDVVILGDGDPQPIDKALIMLNCSLSECCTDVGMIHAPIAAVDEWCNADYLTNSPMYYGDGHPSPTRSVLRTKSTGNIVIPGSGYGLSVNPNPLLPEPDTNEAWIFGTGMIYLAYSDIKVYSPELSERIDYRTNTDQVVAERTVATFSESCCRFAVLADICR